MTQSPAWSVTVAWADLRRSHMRKRLDADKEVRLAVANYLGLESIGALAAEIDCSPWLDGVQIEGRLTARVDRICGVTLDSFEEVVDEPFRVRVVAPGSPNTPDPDKAEAWIDLESDDPPDVIAGNVVDLAAYALEALALGLSPFPRKPGSVFDPPDPGRPPGSFEALAKLVRPRPDE